MRRRHTAAVGVTLGCSTLLAYSGRVTHSVTRTPRECRCRSSRSAAIRRRSTASRPRKPSAGHSPGDDRLRAIWLSLDGVVKARSWNYSTSSIAPTSPPARRWNRAPATDSRTPTPTSFVSGGWGSWEFGWHLERRLSNERSQRRKSEVRRLKIHTFRPTRCQGSDF